MTNDFVTDHVDMDCYLKLAIEITHNAFKSYYDAKLDLFCLRFPNRSENALKRWYTIANRIANQKRNKITLAEVEKRTRKGRRLLNKEKGKLQKTVSSLESFFENGICSVAFCFGDNTRFFQELADKAILEYIRTGIHSVKGNYLW